MNFINIHIKNVPEHFGKRENPEKNSITFDSFHHRTTLVTPGFEVGIAVVLKHCFSQFNYWKTSVT